MVLEAIVSVEGVRKHPVSIFFFAVILSSVCLFAAYYLFPNSSSILSLAFITVGMMPIMHTLMVVEETMEVERPGWAPGFIARHFGLIKVYAWFFLGIIASYAIWYVILPPTASQLCIAAEEPKPLTCLIPAKDKVFSEQTLVFSAITGRVTLGWKECKNPETRSFEKCTAFIFNNNWGVMLMAVALSFLYGAGAIFLIGWNASIIGLFIGMEILDVHWIAGLLRAVSYLPHGIWEIVGYFIGAIAGGIISVAISKRKYRTHEFEIIAKDVLVLVVLATAILLIGALVEAWLILSA